jgi:hypothetical protein
MKNEYNRKIMNIKIGEDECKVGNLTKEQQEQFKELIEKNKDIFSKDNNDIGRSGVIKHRIEIDEDKAKEKKIKVPIRERAYRVDPIKKEIIEKEIKAMLEKGVIRKSTSP